jgi:anti-anti-sigma factor
MRDEDGIVVERAGGVLVVEVRGELDITTVSRWTAVLDAAVCALPGPHLLMLDLAPLTFLSARGASWLFEAVQRCRDRDITGWLITTPGSVVERVVRLTGLAGVAPVFPNRLEAIAASQPVEMRWLPG